MASAATAPAPWHNRDGSGYVVVVTWHPWWLQLRTRGHGAWPQLRHRARQARPATRKTARREISEFCGCRRAHICTTTWTPRQGCYYLFSARDGFGGNLESSLIGSYESRSDAARALAISVWLKLTRWMLALDWAGRN
jgi:hypothetical protein